MHMMKTAHPRLRCRRGFSLIEVLVAIVIFSIGMLGVVGLQARAVQLSVDSEDRNRAAQLADDIVATMWTQGTTSLPSATVTAWEDKVVGTGTTAGVLPGAAASVSAPDSDGVVTVTITWRPPSRKTGEADSTYTTKVAMP
jgi:type IV pilus assembly protein PilV